ncbi:hypothetical protein HDU86_004684 [Geranomyces michiganensis]|nr:hypothetical protein HDU86_004684 [Geranomyces michiganensis]
MPVGDLVSEACHWVRHAKATQGMKMWALINLVVMSKLWKRKGNTAEERACFCDARVEAKLAIEAAGWGCVKNVVMYMHSVCELYDALGGSVLVALVGSNQYKGFIRALKFAKRPLNMVHLKSLAAKSDQILALVNKEESEWAIPCQVYDQHIENIVNGRFTHDEDTYKAARLALIQEMERVRAELQTVASPEADCDHHEDNEENPEVLM